MWLTHIFPCLELMNPQPGKHLQPGWNVTAFASWRRWLRGGFPYAVLDGVTSAQPQRNIDAVRRVCLSSASVEARQNNRDFGPTLYDSTHNEFCRLCIPGPSTSRIRVMPSWHY